MVQLKVSIIIPAYNQAEFLGDAIQSVLNQTYKNFELIVVNDASTDNTFEVVHQFNDPRLKYILHDKNLMLPAARNTGILASSGDIIGCLDADDLFHPKKLEGHVSFLEKSPEIGVTYNNRFEIDSFGNLLGLSEAPPTVNLTDFVLGFPFAPSDMIVRREWLFRVNLFDESYIFYSEDLDIYCRLALAGCEFANIGGYLNYRRRHPDRTIKNVAGRLESAIRALEMTFSDPRCPPEVLYLRPKALGKTYLIWSYWALTQNEATLGREFTQKAVRYDPSYFEHSGQKYLEFMVFMSVLNGDDHETRLRRLFDLLPTELCWLSKFSDSAVAYGYLLRAVRDIIWGRTEIGELLLTKAAKLGARLNEQFFGFLTTVLLNYEVEFGHENTQIALQRLSQSLVIVGNRGSVHCLKASYLINLAFNDYHRGRFSDVPSRVLQAIFYNPKFIINRGVLTILIRSSLNYLMGRTAASGVAG